MLTYANGMNRDDRDQPYVNAMRLELLMIYLTSWTKLVTMYLETVTPTQDLQLFLHYQHMKLVFITSIFLAIASPAQTNDQLPMSASDDSNPTSGYQRPKPEGMSKSLNGKLSAQKHTHV